MGAGILPTRPSLPFQLRAPACHVGEKAFGMAGRLDLLDGKPDRAPRATLLIYSGDQCGGHAPGVLSQKPSRAPALFHLDHESRFILGGQQPHGAQRAVPENGDIFGGYRTAIGAFGTHTDLGQRAQEGPGEGRPGATYDQTGGNRYGQRAERETESEPTHAAERGQAIPSLELIPIAPRRKLSARGLADADQVETPAVACDPDVLGRRPHGRFPEQALTVLHSLPSLFQRREVPALALRAYHPEPTLGGIERQAPADREALQHLVRTEGLLAEHAGLEHDPRPTARVALPATTAHRPTRSPAGSTVCRA